MAITSAISGIVVRIISRGYGAYRKMKREAGRNIWIAEILIKQVNPRTIKADIHFLMLHSRRFRGQTNATTEQSAVSTLFESARVPISA